MNFFVTGGAGFIGSNMVRRLVESGHRVTVYDNFSTGQLKFLGEITKNELCTVVTGDILEKERLIREMKGVDTVIHFSANADVRFGTQHPFKDLEQNTIGTYNVLEAMRLNDIRKLIFSSTGSVYGEAATIPTPEDAEFPVQTSLYGASKLAGEGLIAAYCEGFGMQAWIFRFVSVLGRNYSHGHVFDFFKKLSDNPGELEILGNGKQRKSYIHVEDCLNGILLGFYKGKDKVNIFNLGTDEYCEVNDSVRWICDYLKVKPQLKYTGGDRGWVGDNPFIYLDCSRIRTLGWKPKYAIKKGVEDTLEFIETNQWILTSLRSPHRFGEGS